MVLAVEFLEWNSSSLDLITNYDRLQVAGARRLLLSDPDLPSIAYLLEEKVDELPVVVSTNILSIDAVRL